MINTVVLSWLYNNLIKIKYSVYYTIRISVWVSDIFCIIFLRYILSININLLNNRANPDGLLKVFIRYIYYKNQSAVEILSFFTIVELQDVILISYYKTMTDIKANVWLDDSVKQQVTTILSRLLANEHVLQVKIKQFHWNVRWPHFVSFHAFFDDMQGELDPVIDDSAERIRALGIDSPGTMKEFLDTATLTEYPTQPVDALEMMKLLLADYEVVIQELRNDIDTCMEIGDEGNADFLIWVMRQHEKTAWMLRATVS